MEEIEKERETPRFNAMQRIKRRFFAMRNGVIADTLRRGGSPFRIIFGLNLPQLVEIAGETGADADLARALWGNTSTRESMLLAPMLMPEGEMEAGEALEWAAAVPAPEVADILCHRLLRHRPDSQWLAERMAADCRPLVRYTGMRLCMNLAAKYPGWARAAAAPHACGSDAAGALARRVLEELDFIANFAQTNEKKQ